MESKAAGLMRRPLNESLRRGISGSNHTAAQDMQKAASHGAAVIKDSPHLIYVRAVHERNVEPAWEDPGPKNSQKDSIVATLL
jgi:hypothetical protein